jgi:hypothetical protein
MPRRARVEEARLPWTKVFPPMKPWVMEVKKSASEEALF